MFVRSQDSHNVDWCTHVGVLFVVEAGTKGKGFDYAALFIMPRGNIILEDNKPTEIVLLFFLEEIAQTDVKKKKKKKKRRN